MRTKQPTTNSFARPNPRKTTPEIGQKLAAAQVQLKEEAAARRAVSDRAGRASDARRVARSSPQRSV
jgi:hypothetical protein